MFTLSNFYKSKEWEDLLEQLKLERVNSSGEIVCEHCHKPIYKKYDCIGHHIEELTEANVNDYNISLNKDNIILIHFRCHNQIHERFGYEQPKKVYLVYGSPCSGKSTWVHQNATKDDLILDIDKIWECISVCDKLHKPNRLKANVFGVRDVLIDQIRMRTGQWKRAFVIGGYPLRMDRQRLADRLGAEVVFIDTDIDTCKSRAMNDEWVKYIDEWFDMYQA